MAPNANPMGQVYLGFRSLLFKIAVFVVMAALLAWALGGTLWPKTEVRRVGEQVEIDGQAWALVFQIGGSLNRGTFGFARLEDGGEPADIWPKAENKSPTWRDAMPPVASPDGSRGAFAFEGSSGWTVVIIDDGTAEKWRSTGEDETGSQATDRWAAARALEAFERSGELPQSGTDADATGDVSSAG